MIFFSTVSSAARHGIAAVLAAAVLPACGAAQVLPGTRALASQADLSVEMRAGFDRFLDARLARSVQTRQRLWHRDLSSAEAYNRSVDPNRAHFRHIIGAVDARVPVTELEYISSSVSSSLVASVASFNVYAVRWPVLDGVTGEGLLLQPNGRPAARIVALPDADQTPEMLAGIAAGIPSEKQFARLMAERGCQVLVPLLIDRSDTWSGDPRGVMTNIPHREWIYKQAYTTGRHIIGYEVEKVLAAVSWLAAQPAEGGSIGVAGYGEGALIAFYASAIDPRIQAALVSGYFDSRQQVYREPLYRNVFGLLAEFGDAEIASLIAPRKLVVEQCEGPQVGGPPEPGKGRRYSAAPGQLATPPLESVEAEVRRARSLVSNDALFRDYIELVTGPNGTPAGPGSEPALAAFLRALHVSGRKARASSREVLKDARRTFDANERLHRQLNELTAYSQNLARESQREREDFWKKAQPADPETWDATAQWYRDYAQDEILGRIADPRLPADPRTRKVKENLDWVAYEVVLDVWPEVMDWGYLLVPRAAIVDLGTIALRAQMRRQEQQARASVHATTAGSQGE